MSDTDAPAAFGAHANMFVDHINTTHEDAVLLIARILGGHREAVGARIELVDPRGFELVVALVDGERAARVDFANEISEPAEIRREAIALVVRARQESGEAGETSVEREMNQMRSIRTLLTTVSAVRDVHPHLRLITFRGGDLATFSPLGADTFLYLLLPPPGRDELTIDQSFTWELWSSMPETERPVGAYYTLRAWRPDVAELDMLFVLHEPAGPASEWAARAAPGDPVALWGPREAFAPPADTDRYLLVADDTGLPAVAVILENLPAGVSAHVVAEVDNPAEQQELPARDSIAVEWVYRSGREPGVDHQPMLDAVRALPPPTATTYVWGAGESRAVTAVRRYVRRQLGLRREQVTLVGYWRHASTPATEIDDDAHDDHDE